MDTRSAVSRVQASCDSGKEGWTRLSLFSVAERLGASVGPTIGPFAQCLLGTLQSQIPVLQDRQGRVPARDRRLHRSEGGGDLLRVAWDITFRMDLHFGLRDGRCDFVG